MTMSTEITILHPVEVLWMTPVMPDIGPDVMRTRLPGARYGWGSILRFIRIAFRKKSNSSAGISAGALELPTK